MGISKDISFHKIQRKPNHAFVEDLKISILCFSMGVGSEDHFQDPVILSVLLLHMGAGTRTQVFAAANLPHLATLLALKMLFEAKIVKWLVLSYSLVEGIFI